MQSLNKMHAQDEIVRAFATALNIIIIFGIFSALQLALKNMLIQMVDQMIEFMEFSLQTIKINLWTGWRPCVFIHRFGSNGLAGNSA